MSRPGGSGGDGQGDLVITAANETLAMLGKIRFPSVRAIRSRVVIVRIREIGWSIRATPLGRDVGEGKPYC